jgi:hypothetical protein
MNPYVYAVVCANTDCWWSDPDDASVDYNLKDAKETKRLEQQHTPCECGSKKYRIMRRVANPPWEEVK